MRILVTGAAGFIGSNLLWRLRESGFGDVGRITRDTSPEELRQLVSGADFVFHLGGVNRPRDEAEFATGNADFTRTLCEELFRAGRKATLVFASSTQAALENPYGRSKSAAEDAVLAYAERAGAAAFVYRLTNVFGKWCRPNYNSVVATFCHLIARDQPVSINDPAARLRLIHVDDVTAEFLKRLAGEVPPGGYRVEAGPVYETTVGDLAQTLHGFVESRQSLVTPRVGTGFTRALYATFITYLPPDTFGYQVPRYADPRGEFAEMLKTPDCGQFSYFTAPPGVTRGEHYHHAKTEKFLIVRGRAHFGFRNIQTGERHEVVVNGGEGRIIETVPGWTHNITNVGSDELIVMLWANEIFDRSRPDTYAMKVSG